MREKEFLNHFQEDFKQLSPPLPRDLDAQIQAGLLDQERRYEFHKKTFTLLKRLSLLLFLLCAAHLIGQLLIQGDLIEYLRAYSILHLSSNTLLLLYESAAPWHFMSFFILGMVWFSLQLWELSHKDAVLLR